MHLCKIMIKIELGNIVIKNISDTHGEIIVSVNNRVLR